METLEMVKKAKSVNEEVQLKFSINSSGRLLVDNSPIQTSIEIWNSEKTEPYKKENIVIYNSNFYWCLTDNSTIGNFIDSEWQLIGGGSFSDGDIIGGTF